MFLFQKLDEKYPMTIGMKNRVSNRKNEPVKMAGILWLDIGGLFFLLEGF